MSEDDERCSPIIDLFQRINVSTTTTSFVVQDVADANATWSNGDHHPPLVSTEKLVEEALYRVVIVVVCVIGLVCNIINLLVLSRKSLTATMERLERSAHYGLVGKNYQFTNNHFTTATFSPFLKIFKSVSSHMFQR